MQLQPDYVELFEAYDLAKVSYRRVVALGSDRTDLELSRDRNYNDLLKAGIAIARVGGADALKAASEYLGRATDNGDPKHFDRLWMGIAVSGNHRLN